MTGKIRFIAFAAAFLVALSALGTLGVSASTTYKATEAYKGGKYYSNFSAVELCGDGARDTLAIALSQLGYHEGNSDDDLGGLSADGNRDFVEYNVLYGKLDNNQGNGVSYGYYWCASFVNWCLRQAEVSKEASAGAEVSCQRWLTSCKNAGIYNKKIGYTPKSADIIFFKDRDSQAPSTHMGLVLYSDGKNVYTIEGNTSNGSEFSSDGNYVALKSYPLTSSYIVGYATPKYKTIDDVERIDYSGKTFSAGTYITTDEIYVYADNTYRTRIGKIEPFTVFTVKSVSDGALFLNGGCIKTDNIIQTSVKDNRVSLSYTNSAEKRLYSTVFASVGDTVTLTSSVPKRTDAEFLGWAIAGQEKLYSPSDKLILTEDVELVAIYSDSEMPTVDNVGTEFIAIDPVEETTANGFENLVSTNGKDFLDAINPESLWERRGDIIAIVAVLFLTILIFLALRRYIKKKVPKNEPEQKSKGDKHQHNKKQNKTTQKGQKNSRSKKSKKKKRSKRKKSKKNKKGKK